MTWQFAQGSSSSLKTAGATISAGWAHVAGSHLFVAVTFDNLSATTPTVSSIYKPVGETNNWTLVAYHDSNQAGGGGGVRSELWGLLCTVSEAYTSHTVTLSASVTAKAISTLRYTGGPATLGVVSTTPAGQSGSGTIGTSVSSLAGVTPQANELVLVLAGWEGTDSEDSTMFTYDQWWTNGTSGQGGTSNVRCDLRSKFAASQGDMSIFLDVAGDKGICAVVLEAGPAAPPANFSGSGTLEAHKTRYPDIVKSFNPKYYYRFNDREADLPPYDQGTWWATDSSSYRRHLQVVPSGGGGGWNPGDPMYAGNYDMIDEHGREAFEQPGLVYGGDTLDDFSMNFADQEPFFEDNRYLHIWDPTMDLAGGGRYVSPINEGGPQYMTFTTLINLDEYPATDATLVYQYYGRYACYLTPAGKLRYVLDILHGPILDGYSGGYDFESTTTLQLGVTYHVAFTFDGQNSRIFINGVEDAIEPVNLVVVQPGQGEIQTVTTSGSPTGGTFTLTFNGQTTAPIAYNASVTDFELALEALSNIAIDDIFCGRTTVAGGFQWTVYFSDNGAYKWTDVPQMTASSSLTGGTSPAVTVATDQNGAPSPGSTTYTSGTIYWSSGTGGTNAGERPYWIPGSLYVRLFYDMPSSRVDEAAFWANALTPTQVATLSSTAFVDQPKGATFRGSGELVALQQSYTAEVLASEPAAFYRLGEAAGATVMLDSSGNGRHGSYTGTPALGEPGLLAETTNTAMIPSAAGGSSAHGATVPFASWMLGDGGSYSWEFVMEPGALGGSQMLLNCGSNGDYIYMDSSGYLHASYAYVTSGGTWTSISTRHVLTPGRHHIAFTMDAVTGYRTLWVDGFMSGRRQSATEHTTGSSTYPLRIGYKSGWSTFRGTIDEVVITPHCLAPEEIRNRVYAMDIVPSTPVVHLSGDGVLDAAAAPAFEASVDLSGAGVLMASAGEGYFADAALSGEGALVATGAMHAEGVASLSGIGGLFTTTLPRVSVQTALGAEGVLTVSQAFRPITRTDDPAVDTEETWTRNGFWGKARS